MRRRLLYRTGNSSGIGCFRKRLEWRSRSRDGAEQGRDDDDDKHHHRGVKALLPPNRRTEIAQWL